MPINPNQVTLLRIAVNAAGMDDAAYRMALRNTGGVKGEKPSSKDLSQKSFEDMMALCESMGFVDRYRDAGYWQNKVDNRGVIASKPAVAYVKSLAANSRYRLEAMCLKFSAGRTDKPEQLTPQECWRVTEMYKNSSARETGGETNPEPVAEGKASARVAPMKASPSLFPDAGPAIGLPDAPTPRPRRERKPQPVHVDRGLSEGEITDDDIPF